MIAQMRIMMKCPKCKIYSAVHRTEVRSCPRCGCILDAEELFRLLKKLRISKKTQTLIRSEIQKRICFEKIFG